MFRIITFTTNSLILLMAIFVSSTTQAQIISTVTGNGTGSYSGDGSLATSATVNRPLEVHANAAGDFFIVDSDNHCIRKIDFVTGIISTVAGTGSLGFSGDGGLATAAELNSPTGVCTDPAGNIYISDKGNQRIRRVAGSTGIITTIAGTGTASFSGDGGLATLATISQPHGMQTDTSGNLYFADRTNSRIRKIDGSTGIITTVAGNGVRGFSGDGGAASLASLSFPISVCLDLQGNLYIADQINHRIRKVDTGQIITTVAGIGTPGSTGDGGPANVAQLDQPYDVAVNGLGDLFISDANNQKIRMVSSSNGNISTFGGTGTGGFSGDGGPATLAQLSFPSGIHLDLSGNLFISDKLNHRLRKISSCNNTSAIQVNRCDSFISPSGKFTYSKSGLYVDTLKNSAGCDSTIRIHLTIPIIDTLLIKVGSTLVSSDTSSGYQWLDCNNGFAPLVGETNKVYQFSFNGSFAVELTQNGCVDTSHCMQLTNASINRQIGQNPQFALYPNPVQDYLFIDRYEQDNMPANLIIYDSKGREVKHLVFSNKIQAIDVEGIPAGYYILKIQTNKISKSRSFIKE